MEKPSFKLVGAPCGQHGQYTFYKALRVSGERDRIVAIGEFFFVRIWQDSELVSIGELQLLWTDRVSDQTLVSLRLYFLPENTPDGRSLHGEDEVMVINEKVVLKAEDLLSWMCDGGGWSTGVRAVWRGACAPPGPGAGTDALHATRLDFTDVDKEKGALEPDPSSPGVVVFSYPRYCRYRAVAARLGGVQAAWLRDALVAALGGYAAPTANTRILYCKESFEYPELEGHEFVCNHLAPRLKGRPRGRRRRQPRSRDRERRSDGERSSDSDAGGAKAPRRVSLRNGASPEQLSDEEAPSERAFLRRLRLFYRGRDDAPPEMQSPGDLKHLSLGSVYARVVACGGFASACRRRAWRALQPDRPHRLRDAYQRYLLPYENHERSRGRLPALSQRRNGSLRVGSSGPMILDAIDTIDVTDSPPRDTTETEETPEKKEIEKRLRTPSPQREEDSKEEFTISKPAEELNREFLDSLPKEDKPEKPLKISVKPVEKLIERNDKEKSNIAKLFEENSALVAELSAKHKVMDSKVIDEIASRNLSEGSTMFLNELAVRLNLGPMEASLLRPAPPALNGHDTQQQPPRPPPAHPAARSSLRHVRVKPARTPQTHTQTQQTHRGIGHVPATGVTSPAPRPRERHSDDEIVEVPYKPKTPEIIDLDEYPESPQSQVKKKKLDILKERGLEVTAIPTPQWGVPPQVPLMGGLNPPVMLNPAMQHQIMTQASLFQMYNIIPQNYANGIQPPKVIQATCTFGTSGPEKTVYGNPKDPFMPPPHVLHGAPIKPQRNLTPTEHPEPPLPPRPDILDLTCKVVGQQAQKPAVEIVRIPQAPSPSKIAAQNLSKNYTLIDGKAVVGSNLEITLVNPKNSSKNRPPQKRSSNGKFVSTKTPTPPKDYPKPYPSPSNIKKQPIIVPNYPLNRDEVSPASSTSSRDSLKQDIPKTIMDIQKSAVLDMHKVNMLDMQKSAASLMDMQKSMPNMLDMQKSIPTMLDMHKSMPNMLDMQKSMPSMLDMQKSMPSMLDMQKSMPAMSHFMDPLYMNALYNSLAGQMDQRQLAMYRDLVANQFRGYPGMLSSVTPTTKN